MSTIKDSEGKEYIIFDESELYDDKKMGDSLQDFEILQILGKGSYGFVAKIRSKKNKKIYAMKKIDFSQIGSKEEKYLCEQEIILLQKLEHPNVNKYYKSFKESDCLYIIIEFMDNGDIDGFIQAHKQFNSPATEDEVWNILLQSMNALYYIHSNNIIHRDIKPANLFMTNYKVIKIGDFGVSAILKKDQPKRETMVGTPFYMSPEILNKEKYDNTTDVYSLGFSIFELCYFDAPRIAMLDPMNEGKYIFRNKEIKFNKDYYSNDLKTIINKMIKPKNRPNSKQIYEELRRTYTRKLVKISSLSAVTRCLYSFSSLTKFFLEEKKQSLLQKEKLHVTKGYINLIEKYKNRDNKNDGITSFKEILSLENPKFNSEEELDPRFILTIIMEKMHKELNKEQKIELKQKQYIINSTFNGQDEDKSNHAEMMEKFVKYFTMNFNSLISNSFFGMYQEKKTCQNCFMISFNFGCFCILYMDLKDYKSYQNIDLYNLFMDMKSKEKFYNIEDHIYCNRCLSYQNHTQNKRIFCLSNNLIISFDRGLNYTNKMGVSFPLTLDLSKFVESEVSTKIFQLVGIVKRVEEGDKFYYISYTKDPQSSTWYRGKDNINMEISQNEILNNAPNEFPILLFYFSK